MGFFADLQNPDQCDYVEWANQLRTILCQADCQLRNIVLVPCGETVFESFVGDCDDFGSILVIETCAHPRLWYYFNAGWLEFPHWVTGGPVYPVLIASQNEIAYPLPYGSSHTIDWQDMVLSDDSMITLDAGGILTCKRKGWYRFTGACSLRFDANPSGGLNTPGSQHYHRLRWLHGSGNDHRADFSARKEAFPTTMNLAINILNGAANFDIILPRDPLGTNATFLSWSHLRQTGLRYLDVGDSVRMVMETYINVARPTITWGIGGILADIELYEYLVVERLELP